VPRSHEGVPLIHGDSREVLRGIPRLSVDAIVTDPPYGDFQSEQSGDRDTEGWAEWDGTGVTFDPDFWRECLQVCVPGAYLMAFNTPRIAHRMTTAIEAAGWEIKDAIVWHYKTGQVRSPHSLKPSWEHITVARAPLEGSTIKRNIELYGTGGLQIAEERALDEEGRWPTNIMSFPKPSPREKDGNTHPTVKPEALMRKLVRLATPPDGVVLDPFLGSGTTAVAAAIEGRRCIGIETGAAYLEIARRRLARVS
jgi:DNA modification methylase